MEDYRKLALEAAMKIPYQTHSELLLGADKIYEWLTKEKPPFKYEGLTFTGKAECGGGVTRR